MHPYGGTARSILSAIAPASLTTGLAGVGVVAGVSTWIETTGKTLGIIVAIVSALGYLYRTLIRPMVHAIFEIRDELKKLDTLDERLTEVESLSATTSLAITELERVIVHKEGT